MRPEHSNLPIALRRLVDYHVHSLHSIDGESSVEDMCRQAVRLGLAEIGFCEHVDFTPNGLGSIDYERYSEELDRCRSQYDRRLKIRKGIEVDYSGLYRKQIEEWLEGKHFDFKVGSTHYADHFIFDRRSLSDVSPVTLIRRYYNRVREAVESQLFDVIGHFDIIREFVPANQDPISPAPDIIDSIFEKMVMNEMHLEINSWRRTGQEPFPCKELICRYLRKRGEFFSFGSDAHSCRTLAAGVVEAEDTLMSLRPGKVHVLFTH